MKAMPLHSKTDFSDAAKISPVRSKVDKLLYAQIFLIIILLFVKVYVRCLYISQEKKIAELRYKLKSEQGVVGKLKTEHSKYIDRERLDMLSKAFNREDNIVVYTVR